MKKSLLTIPCCLLLLAGCQEAKNKAATSVLEKSIEAVSGKKIDMADMDNIEKNKPVVDLVLDGENISKNFENGFGSITASEETIAITVNNGTDQQNNILLGFTGKDLIAGRPIKGKIAKGENSGFTFSMMKVNDNSAETFVSFEAEGEIIAMSEAKTIIKVKGSLASTLDADHPEKWKHYEGTITLNYPVFQAIGSTKEAFMY